VGTTSSLSASLPCCDTVSPEAKQLVLKQRELPDFGLSATKIVSFMDFLGDLLSFGSGVLNQSPMAH
jgi:hypothetical protein